MSSLATSVTFVTFVHLSYMFGNHCLVVRLAYSTQKTGSAAAAVLGSSNHYYVD